ncbi:MAG: cobyrinate a,c-diamide synthase [Bacillota bacterium]|nr:cobyrinate a,c-diamide synthase [Bacillota bacterium]
MASSAFVLGATQSNSGKTTMAMALMAAFRKKGYTVQPFKVGPDYIDPMYHTEATARASRNLDSFMLDENTIKYLFQKNSRDADIAIIEGVMGLYDGRSGFSLEGSSAHISEILEVPVILVVNGNGMSLSAAAMINGFRDFSPKTKIAGVLLNNIKNDSGYLHLKEIIEYISEIPVLGYLPQNEKFKLNDRHLGLYCSEEIEDLEAKLDILSNAVIEHCDLEKLAAIAGYNRDKVPGPTLPKPLKERVRVGIARDKAFNFYYQDSLDLLTELGAELVSFSPLNDKSLPDVDCLYFGGGYPELNLAELSENKDFLQDLRQKLESGLPCYGECGGFIYLGRSMTIEGKKHELTSFFPFDFVMTDRLQHFGYMEAKIAAGTPLSPEGEVNIRGHEFHYTKRVDDSSIPGVYRVSKSRRDKVITWEEGYSKKNTLGAYPHFNFYSNPEVAKNFLQTAAAYRKKVQK